MHCMQVRDINVDDGQARAFFVVRKDGSVEDFSYRKIAVALFPDQISPFNPSGGGSKRQRTDNSHSGGGRGTRGGTRGRGRGGRGRGRGRGRK